jgi:hypothetical protein
VGFVDFALPPIVVFRDSSFLKDSHWTKAEIGSAGVSQQRGGKILVPQFVQYRTAAYSGHCVLRRESQDRARMARQDAKPVIVLGYRVLK